MNKFNPFTSTTTSSSPTPKSDPPPHHANTTRSLFRNPWPSAQPPSYTDLYNLTTSSSFPLSWYSKHTPKSSAPSKDLEVVTPDWGKAQLEQKATKGVKREDCIIGTWLGHASALVSIPLAGRGSFNVLYDPIFSPRAGPTPGIGPARLLPPPCEVEDLPGVDVVLLSHNHYDHADYPSIVRILKKWPESRLCVPLGMGTWLEGCGVGKESIWEGDWWEHTEMELEGGGKVRITGVPAQHTSGRGFRDKEKSLWCGWVVEHFIVSSEGEVRKSAIYHAGDTGYRRFSPSALPTSWSTDPGTPIPNPTCPIFGQMRKHFSHSEPDSLPFDLAFLPIWRGGTLSFFAAAGVRLNHSSIPTIGHSTPEDAVEMHKEVGSRCSVGVHWGTFVGSAKEGREARAEWRGAAEESGVGWFDGDEGKVSSGKEGKGRAGVVDIGGCVVIEVAKS